MPQMCIKDSYKESIEPYLTEGKTLAFAHGFNIHFGCIKPPKNVNVIMIAPKGPGHTVRSEYLAGKGVPCLVAVEQDATGDALDIALALSLIHIFPTKFCCANFRGGPGRPKGGKYASCA